MSKRTPPNWTTIEVGDALWERVEPPLTITDFVIYQGAANDHNPIHHDAEFARAAGYPGPFAVGMLAAGVLADLAVVQFGEENIRRLKIQFREQAWPGDVIRYTGVVVEKRVEDGQKLVDLELSATRQSGGVHIQGWATVVVDN